MPMQWVPPEVFMTMRDKLRIYHTYKDQGDIRLEYWYTTDEGEDPQFMFDIRELSTYDPKKKLDMREIRRVIREAYAKNELLLPDAG
jgi:hypothetical protein